MADIQGRRVPTDFPDRSGLSAGTPGLDDLAKGLKPSNIQTFPTVPVYESQGLQRKRELGSDA